MNKCLTCGKNCKRIYCNQECYSKSPKLKEQAKKSLLISKNKENKWALGHKLPEKCKENMFKKGHHLNAGKPKSEETKQKIRNNLRGRFVGVLNPNWKGTTTLLKRLRKTSDYKLWRKAVFERDNWTCIFCGARSCVGKSVYLQADHIKPFALFPELRFAIDNGRTLCKECHMKTDTYGERCKKWVGK
jgi:hypothetical protein